MTVSSRSKWRPNMTDHEIVELMSAEDHLSKARRMFYHGCAVLEQAEAQQKPLTIIERRRMEFMLTEKIINAYLACPKCGGSVWHRKLVRRDSNQIKKKCASCEHTEYEELNDD